MTKADKKQQREDHLARLVEAITFYTARIHIAALLKAIEPKPRKTIKPRLKKAA